MRVKLDIDGVIANFTKSACKTMGVPYDAKAELSDYGWLFRQCGDAACYKKIKGHLFWTSIEKFPWADELVDIVDRESKGNWAFLTKPMVDQYCYSGKAEWVMAHYRKHLQRLIILNGDKSLMVRDRKDVLIDDHPKNVSQWEAAGGTKIHWIEVGDQYDSGVIKLRLENIRQQLIQIRETS